MKASLKPLPQLKYIITLISRDGMLSMLKEIYVSVLLSKQDLNMI